MYPARNKSFYPRKYDRRGFLKRWVRLTMLENTAGTTLSEIFLSVCHWMATAITWSTLDTFSSRSNHNYGNNGRCTMLGTKHRLCSNNCCTRSGSSCRWAYRSARPDREHDDDFRSANARCPSTVSLSLPSRRSLYMVYVLSRRSRTLPPSRPER